MLKVGIGISYYGPAAPAHRDSIRSLRSSGQMFARDDFSLQIMELSGSAYPEIAYAELCRAALAEKIDVLIFASHRSSFQPGALKYLAESCHRKQQVLSAVSTKHPAPLLAFTAVPLAALLAMSEADARTYTNTGVLDTGFSEKARPFASPWRQLADGSVRVEPLESGIYLTPELALLTRATRAGFPEGCLEDCSYDYLGHAEPTLRMVMGDSAKRGSNGIYSNYAFCVPTFGGLDHHQQDALWNLELAGCTVIEYRDCPYIDQARSYLTKLALDSGHDGVFFIDHDIIFIPRDALNMIARAEEKQDVVSAVYCMRKTAHSLIGATAVSVGTEVTFFEGGGLVPALYSGLGFSAIPRAVIEALDTQLPEIYSHFIGCTLRPYYALDVNGTFYSGEDASFCARVQGLTIKKLEGNANPNGLDWDLEANAEGALTPHKVWLDTSVRIFHRGSYDYGIEDHNIAVPRYETVKATLLASRKEVRRFFADRMSLQAQERAQGVDVGAEAPHSILEELGPCKHCGCLASLHETAALCNGCPGCPGYEEMTVLKQVTS